jgi:hypothetical protein
MREREKGVNRRYSAIATTLRAEEEEGGGEERDKYPEVIVGRAWGKCMMRISEGERGGYGRPAHQWVAIELQTLLIQSPR